MRTRRRIGARACVALLVVVASVAGVAPATVPVRAGAGAGVGAGASAAAPEPVAAGATDIAVGVVGTTLRNSAPRKVVTATIVNRGPEPARGVEMRLDGWVDGEVLSPASLDFCPSGGGPEAAPGSPVVPSLQVPVTGTCTVAELAAGRSVSLRATLRGAAGAVGTVGRLTLVVSHSGGDPRPADNTVSAALTLLGASGKDLYARAWDAPLGEPGPAAGASGQPGGSGRGGVVPPGRGLELHYEVGNRGTGWVAGMIVTVRLPGHVRFAGSRPGCEYDASRRTATCGYSDLPLLPAVDDTDPADGVHSALRFRHPLVVEPGAPAPARLTGGRVTVVPAQGGYPPGAGAGTRLPDGVTGVRATETSGLIDTARFAVRTAAAGPDGTGGPAGLPVTGAPTDLLGGAGTGLIAAGVLLLLLARRPRPGHRRRRSR